MRKKRVFIVLGFALAVIFILGLVIGSVAMPLEETGKILANELFLSLIHIFIELQIFFLIRECLLL